MEIDAPPENLNALEISFEDFLKLPWRLQRLIFSFNQYWAKQYYKFKVEK